MDIKYPKTKKTTEVAKTSKTKSKKDDVLKKQQLQIDELKANSKESKIQETIFATNSKTYQRAYGKVVALEARFDDYCSTTALNYQNIQKLQSQVSDLENSNSSNALELTDIREDISNLQTSCDTLFQASWSNDEDIARLDANIASLQENIETNNTEISNLQTSVSNCISTDEEHSAHIQDLKTKHNQNLESINSINSQIVEINNDILENSQKILELELNFSEQDTTLMAEQIETNTNNIDLLTAQLNGLSSDLSEQKSIVDNAVANCQTMHQTCANNTEQLNSLSHQVQQNSTKIDELINSGVSGGGSSADLTGLTAQVDTNTQDIAELKAQQTINTQDIKTLMDFKNSFDLPVDPYYAPKTFSDYPAGTILQGYAEFNRRYDKAFTSTMITPVMIYSSEADSEGTFKIKINFTANQVFTGLLTVFNNEVEIYRETIDFDDESLEFCLEREIKGITLADGNTFYAKIGANSIKFTLTNLWSCLISPNAEIINYISPYSVQYFKGKYYLADCSGGTAKTAVVDVDKMTNIDAVEWTDTGIVCDKYVHNFAIEVYGDTYDATDKLYGYTYNDNSTFVNVDKDITFTRDNFIIYEQEHVTSVVNRWTGISINQTTRAMTLSTCAFATNTQSFLFSYQKENEYVTSSGNNCMYDFVENYVGHKFGIGTLKNGMSYLENLVNSTHKNVELGFGTRNHYYLTEYISSRNDNIAIFSKHYDKILKYTIKYTGTAFGEIETIEEIGAYEEYFEGINNDYFVVKNGKLLYYKKPTENTETESTENESTTTE